MPSPGLQLHRAPGSTFEIRLDGVDGRERLNALFAYELLLSTDEPLRPDQIDELLEEPCAITLSNRPGDVVHGILSEIRYVDIGGQAPFRYRARLVPTVWLLTLASTNRAYKNVTTSELVGQVLGRYSLVLERGKPSEAGYQPGDYRVEHGAEGPVHAKTHEYVVQYHESDWDFVQRKLEASGMSYWFEQHHDREELVVAGSIQWASRDADHPVKLTWRARSALSAGEGSSVWDFDSRTARTPARVVLQDYNFSHPSLTLSQEAEVGDGRGFGTIYSARDPFDSEEEGAGLATLRAERLASQRQAMFGASDCPALHAGHRFEVADHPIDAMNGPYVVVEARHRAGAEVEIEREVSTDDPGERRVTFVAIPADATYRPERRTPQPNIHGVMHAHIAGGAGPMSDADPPKYADMDAKGRYRVVMPFYRQLDPSKSADDNGAAATDDDLSCWIRVAQANAGAGYGIHHPLRQGTEVLIAHIDGNPERPVIIGAVPNETSVGPTTQANPTQSILRTAAGIGIEMDDRASS